MTRRCTRSSCTSAPTLSPPRTAPPHRQPAFPRKRPRLPPGPATRRAGRVTRRTRPAATSRTARRSASAPRRCSAAPRRCPGWRHGRDGAVLDLGRRRRRPSAALRRAARERDTCRCRFPGCESRRVDLHHIPYWSQRRPHQPGQPDQPVPVPPHARPRPRVPHRRQTRRRVRVLPPRRHPLPASPALPPLDGTHRGHATTPTSPPRRSSRPGTASASTWTTPSTSAWPTPGPRRT